MYMYIHVYIYIYIHIMYIPVCVYTYMYIYIYIYICICTHTCKTQQNHLARNRHSCQREVRWPHSVPPPQRLFGWQGIACAGTLMYAFPKYLSYPYNQDIFNLLLINSLTITLKSTLLLIDLLSNIIVNQHVTH